MKPTKVYMVSIPMNAEYAEWWYIVGLFSTREKRKNSSMSIQYANTKSAMDS